MHRTLPIAICLLSLPALAQAQSVGLSGRLEGQRGQGHLELPPLGTCDAPKLSSQGQTAVDLARRVLASKGSAQRAMARRLAGGLERRPHALRDVLDNGTPEERHDVAAAVLEAWMKRPDTDSSFDTYEHFILGVEMMEAIDPEAEPADIARLLRRHFYADDLFEVTGLKVGAGAPQVSEELAQIDQRLGNLKPWQVVPGVAGRRTPEAETDVAHALVALDAYAFRRREGGSHVRGRFDALLFTEIGDVATEALSAIGLREAGDYNPEDGNGNRLGGRLVRDYADGKATTLSGLLRRHAEPSE